MNLTFEEGLEEVRKFWEHWDKISDRYDIRTTIDKEVVLQERALKGTDNWEPHVRCSTGGITFYFVKEETNENQNC